MSNNITWTFSTLGCPELSLSQIIETAKSNGLNALELRCVDDRVDLPKLFTEQFGTPEKLKAYLDEQGVKVVALDSSFKLVGNNDESRSELLEFMPWAQVLETPYIRIFDGGTYGSEISDEDLNSALETVKWWRGEREKNNWSADIMIETHDCLTRADDIVKFEEAVEGEPVVMLWDTHHTWKKAGEDVKETWKKVRPYTKHTHVKDSITKPSARHPFTYVMLEEGEFPYMETVNMFKEDGYEGVVSLEWEKKWHPYLEDLDVALAKCKELGCW